MEGPSGSPEDADGVSREPFVLPTGKPLDKILT